MKILFVTQYFAPEIGAAPVRLTALADALQDDGHEVTVLTSLPNYPGARTFDGYRGRIWATDRRPSGVVIKRVWSYPAMGSGIRRYLNYLSFAVMASMRLWSPSRPDVVFIESPPLTTFVVGWLFGTFRRAPTVVNIADLWPAGVVALGLADPDSLIVRVAERFERWAYSSSTLVSHVTRGIGSDIAAMGVPEEKLVFLPNGADTDTFKPRPSGSLAGAFGLDSRPIVTFAGTHSVGAGMDIIVDAAERLDGVVNVQFALVGDGPMKQHLADRVKRSALSNVSFFDPVQPEQVARFYAASVSGLVTLQDSPLLPGTRPSKMFPALACGRPVVFSGAGEGADLVTEHQMGLVTPPGDATALAEAIREIVEDPDRASEMGTNGRHFVEQNLSWSAIARNWIAQVADRLQRAT